MPTLVLKLANIWEREDGKFVDFNDPTQVSRNALECLQTISIHRS